MVNFDFLEKELGTVSPLHFVYDFLRKMFLMLPGQISWAICVLQLFVNQVVMSQILKLTLSF